MLDLTFFKMAQESDRCPARWRRPPLRWMDQAERGWSIPVLLAAFVAIWTCYLMVAYIGSDLHPDVLETWTLGRHFEWGNPKHPPLMGWIARLWTDVFPLSNWSMQLLAMFNAAVGLWAVDLIARQFVSGDKRVLILLLLMLTPVYQFHAQRFNANTVLLSVWPLATYCFLRSFQTRSPSWAAAAGLSAGLAMLGKYYSVFLVVAFVCAAIFHHLRWVYLRSSAPWISAVAGVITLGPHLNWLVRTGAPTFDYAMAHAGIDRIASLRETMNFVLGLTAAVSISAITWLLIAGRRLARAASDFANMDDGLKLLALVGAATILLPILTSLIVGTDLPALWAFQGLYLFVIPLVASTGYAIERFYIVNTLVLVFGIAFISVTIAAPLHALYRNSYGYEEGRNFYSQAAQQLTDQWRAISRAPLSAVSGADALAFAVAFYSPDHPFYSRPFAYQYSWTLPRRTTLDRGWAALCFADQVDCLEWMRLAAARAHRTVQGDFEVQASLLGVPGVRRTIVFLVIPPRDGDLPDKSSSAKRTRSAQERSPPSTVDGW